MNFPKKSEYLKFRENTSNLSKNHAMFSQSEATKVVGQTGGQKIAGGNETRISQVGSLNSRPSRFNIQGVVGNIIASSGVQVADMIPPRVSDIINSGMPRAPRQRQLATNTLDQVRNSMNMIPDKKDNGVTFSNMLDHQIQDQLHFEDGTPVSRNTKNAITAITVPRGSQPEALGKSNNPIPLIKPPILTKPGQTHPNRQAPIVSSKSQHQPIMGNRGSVQGVYGSNATSVMAKAEKLVREHIDIKIGQKTAQASTQPSVVTGGFSSHFRALNKSAHDRAIFSQESTPQSATVSKLGHHMILHKPSKTQVMISEGTTPPVKSRTQSKINPGGVKVLKTSNITFASTNKEE